MQAAIEVEHVWKKFRRGELHDSLRDFLPALVKRMVGRGTPATELGQGDFWALKDLNFSVLPGEALGVIGPNGAGKSTLLKVLSRILRPNRGRYVVRGRLRALIEVAAGFHVDLTGRENIFLNGAILGMSRKQIENRCAEIIEFADIADAIDTPVKRYSSGMVARLGFSIAAHMEPEILLVDEVLSVGDVGFQSRCLAHMKKIRSAGVAMIFVSHDIPQVMQLCDRVLVLDKGQMAHYGDRETGSQIYYKLAAGRANYSGADVDDQGKVRVSLESATNGEIAFGQELAFVVDYNFPPPVPDAGLVIRLQSGDGLGILSLHSKRGELTIKPGAGRLVCRLPGFRLLPGTYKITAHLQDRTSERILDHFLHQMPITVFPAGILENLPAPGTAVVDCQEHWQAG